MPVSGSEPTISRRDEERLEGARLEVWIDQDLCTGDGICEDVCPEVFVILDDGIAYVREANQVMNDPGGHTSPARVSVEVEDRVIAAAQDCPGECIFIESRAGSRAA